MTYKHGLDCDENTQSHKINDDLQNIYIELFLNEEASWHSFAEIRRDFGNVDSVGNQHYVFNIGGNKYRLIVVVKFIMGYVFIRYVGTHNEYDKINASTI